MSNFKPICRSFIFAGVLNLMCKPVFAKDIVIHIENIDTRLPGNLMVMIFEKDGFPKNHAKAIVTHVTSVSKEKITVHFPSVPDEFAVKILHDEDKTGEVSKNWTGILPSEGLGFSNGAKLRFGPPSYERAKLKIEETNTPIIISMIYP